MSSDVKFEQVVSIEEYMDQLVELLVKVVDDGASIGFLPPMKTSAAKAYWQNVLKSEVILYVAKVNDVIAGSVQLHLCTKQNGEHRAEVAKLMTHPQYRQNGIGRSLMQTVEARAKEERRSLIVLDTREGDPSNHLYASLGFIQAGRIPNYAKSASGKLDASIFYFKEL